MRETEVTAVSQTSYSKLIGEFVNEAKREVEDAHHWVALRDTVVATTVAGDFRYYLSNVGIRFKLRNVWDDTSNCFLEVKNSAWLTQQFNTSAQTGRPLYYDFAGATQGDYQIDLYPIPDAAYSINFNIIKSQADLALDATELEVHDYPVMLGAYAKAISERGDDNGTQYPVALQAYKEALGDAIALDAAHNNLEAFNWVVQ